MTDLVRFFCEDYTLIIASCADARLMRVNHLLFPSPGPVTLINSYKNKYIPPLF